MSTVIEAKDVFVLYSAAFGDIAALRGLSLTVEEGAAVAVIGPSGAGKTTLLELCATLRRPSSGQFTVLGTDLATAGARRLDRLRTTQIGIIRQHYERALPRELTVNQIIALPLRMAGRYHQQHSPQWVAQLLDDAGLSHRAQARPDQLSGGEQQRVAVCAALVTRPRLLLADEPTGELDPKTSAGLLDTLLTLTRTVGATALIVTHDPAVAERSDRVIHIRDGRLAAEGTTNPTLVLDQQGWLRLPETLRDAAGFHDRVAASARWGVIELRTKVPTRQTSSQLQPGGAPSSTTVVVNLEQVSKRYRQVDSPVLDQFTHRFTPQRLHAIVGASGSGKTTLLNLIAALEAPDSGQITVAGQRVDTLGIDQAARLRRETVGYLSQHSTLIEHLSVQENIELGLTLRGMHPVEAAQQAAAWLEWIGLAGYASRRADQLSGGEQRRVALARTLAPRPLLLLADEPTAHLDQLSGRLVIRLLQEAVTENGTTVIAASHDADVIAASDTVLRIDNRRGDHPSPEHQTASQNARWKPST